MPIKLSPTQIEQLHQALLDAFPFEHQIKNLSLFGIGVHLQKYVGPVAGNDEKIRLLIEQANALDKAGALLAKARELNADNELLKKAAGDFQMNEEVEALVRQDPETFPDPEVLRDLMAERERAVCRIQIKLALQSSRYGTGFLVGSNLVLTCYHVMEDVVKGVCPPASVEMRFGYRILADHREVPGEKFYLADDWLAASSPEADLDFALIRLSKAPEGRTLGTYAGAPKRRVIDLKEHQDGETNNTVIALQHPDGDRLKVTFGSVTSVEENKIAYSANTLPGSSGSPILLNDCTVTALHRQEHDSKANAGIRISKIYAQLVKDGVLPA